MVTNTSPKRVTTLIQMYNHKHESNRKTVAPLYRIPH